MKYDEKRRGYVLSPEEVESLNARMKEARDLAEIIEIRTRLGIDPVPTRGGKTMFS